MPEAEMSQDEQKWILPLFLAEYNTQHKTSFDLKQKLSENENPDRSCDHLFKSPKDGELKIQWTRAGTSARERVSLKQEDMVVRTLRNALDTRNHRGYRLDIMLRRVPSSEDEIRQLVNGVMLLFQQKTPCQPDPNLTLCYEYSQFDTDILTTMPVERLAIYRIAGSDSPTTICCSAPAELAPAAEKRAHDALIKKIKRYGQSGHDLVLVIHFDFEPYMEDEIERLKAALTNETPGFKEIWTFCHWARTGDTGKAHLVWTNQSP